MGFLVDFSSALLSFAIEKTTICGRVGCGFLRYLGQVFKICIFFCLFVCFLLHLHATSFACVSAVMFAGVSAVMKKNGRVFEHSTKTPNFLATWCSYWIFFISIACLHQPGDSYASCSFVEQPPPQIYCVFHSSHIRHLGFVPRANGFRSCHQYYSNAASNFQQIRLLNSGGISPNPGPVTCSHSASLKSAECLYPHLWNELLTLKDLKLGHLNCNGLVGKIIEVKALLFAVKFDILTITDTHFRNTTKDSSINIPGYKIRWPERWRFINLLFWGPKSLWM